MSKLDHTVRLLLLLCAAAPALADNLPPAQLETGLTLSDSDGDRTVGTVFAASHALSRHWSLSGDYAVESLHSADVDLVAPLAHRLDEARQSGHVQLDAGDGDIRYTVGVAGAGGNSAAGTQVHAGLSEGLFHGLTTLSVDVAEGWDSLYRVDALSNARDSAVRNRSTRHDWNGSIEQIVTPALKLRLEAGFLAQSGALANPNLGVRYQLDDGLVAIGQEVTPGTRSRYHAALKAQYAPSPASVLSGGLGYGYDTWGIRSREFSLGWQRTLRPQRLSLDLHGRVYSQSRADFYSDLSSNAPGGEISRDRSLAQHQSLLLGAGLDWTLRIKPHLGVKHWHAAASLDLTQSRYDDLRDATQTVAVAGTERLVRKTGAIAQIRLSGTF